MNKCNEDTTNKFVNVLEGIVNRKEILLDEESNTTFKGGMFNILCGLKDLPPSEILLKRLGICRGNLTLVVGFGGSSKSFILQSLAASCIMEQPFLGEFEMRKYGNVVHIDGEQGLTLTAKRYIRLLNGIKSKNPNAKIIHNIYRSKPLHKVDQWNENIKESIPQSKKDLLELCKGATLVIIDSLKNISSCDENTSEIEKVVSMLKQVAEESNTAILLIHHMGKNHKTTAAETAARGHTSIYDVSDVQINVNCLNKEKHIFEMSCAKVRDGVFFQPLQYTMVNEGEFNVEHDCTESVAVNILEKTEQLFENKQLALRFKILDKLNNNNNRLAKINLFDLVKGTKSTTYEQFDEMVKEKWLDEHKEGRAIILSITPKGMKEYNAMNESLKNNSNTTTSVAVETVEGE